MTFTDHADLRAQIKAAVDRWALESLVEDENIRALPASETYAAVVIRRRPLGLPDETSEILSAADLKAFKELPADVHASRLGSDGYLEEGPVTDAELRAARLHQSLEGANQRHLADDESIAAVQVTSILQAAGISIDRDSPAFAMATHQLMKAQVMVQDAINRRHTVRWRPDRDADPAQGNIDRLRSTAGVLVGSALEGIKNDARSRVDLLSVVAHEAVLEGVKLGRFLPGRGREYDKAVALFIHWAGSDHHVQDVTAKMAGDFRQAIIGFPVNANKRPGYRSLSFAEASAKARADNDSSTISATTANGNYLTPLRSIFQWALVTGKISINPFASVRVDAAKRSAALVRRGFRPEEMEALLKAPVFTGSNGLSGEDLYRPGSVRVADWRYWLPVISLFSGARLNELAGLHLVDFDEQDTVPLFRIREFSTGQRIKSAAADRVVPVHSALIDLGLIDLVKKLRGSGHTQLFPDLRPGPTGYFSYQPSRFFGRLIDRYCGKDPTLTFHGFRHSFITKLRESRVPKEVRTCLVGHEDGDTHDSYGEEPFARLNEGVQSVVWAGLDLSSIRLPNTKP